MKPQRYLAAALFALSALYVAWFARDAHALAGLLVFALPPALLAVSALAGWRRAGFTSAVIALLWFSHGVMLLWSEPQAWPWTRAEVVLALLVIHAACLPGIRARRAARKAGA